MLKRWGETVNHPCGESKFILLSFLTWSVIYWYLLSCSLLVIKTNIAKLNQNKCQTKRKYSWLYYEERLYCIIGHGSKHSRIKFKGHSDCFEIVFSFPLFVFGVFVLERTQDEDNEELTILYYWLRKGLVPNLTNGHQSFNRICKAFLTFFCMCVFF